MNWNEMLARWVAISGGQDMHTRSGEDEKRRVASNFLCDALQELSNSGKLSGSWAPIEDLVRNAVVATEKDLLDRLELLRTFAAADMKKQQS